MTIRTVPDRRLSQLLLTLPLLAWFGNMLYAIGHRGSMLEFLAPATVALALTGFVILHGGARYGARNMLTFTLSVFAFGWVFESVSVITGYPFGRYHYDDVMAPFLGHVPVFVLLAYLLMGYVSWSMACLLLRQRSAALKGPALVIVPVLAAMLMVVWDLSMDPLRATVEGRWIWHGDGSHLGIPLTNYLGWFLVTWLMFQTFAGLMCYAPPARPTALMSSRSFWLSVPLAYGAFAGEYLLNPFTGKAGEVNVSSGTQPLSLQQLYLEVAALTALTIVPLVLLGAACAVLVPTRSAKSADKQSFRQRPPPVDRE